MMMMANDEEQQLVCRVFWNVCCCFVCRRLVFYGCVNLCRVSLSSLSMGRCVAGSRSGMLLWAEKLFVFFVTDVNVGGFISPRLHDGGCLFYKPFGEIVVCNRVVEREEMNFHTNGWL